MNIVSAVVPSAHISPGVRQFIATHIHSVTQLELLLLLHRDPAAEWTAEQISRDMRYPKGWLADQLARFASAGLVSSRGASDARFRYNAASDRAGVIDELAEIYRQRRTAVTTLIFSPSKDDVRLLSDAFRIRRDEVD